MTVEFSFWKSTHSFSPLPGNALHCLLPVTVLTEYDLPSTWILLGSARLYAARIHLKRLGARRWLWSDKRCVRRNLCDLSLCCPLSRIEPQCPFFLRRLGNIVRGQGRGQGSKLNNQGSRLLTSELGPTGLKPANALGKMGLWRVACHYHTAERTRTT